VKEATFGGIGLKRVARRGTQPMRHARIPAVIATHEQLNAEVDRQFFAQHPDAPRKLDPHEPSHQQYVHEWNQIRDHTANAWSDHYLKESYPAAPDHLDHNNPAHHDYVEYWKDMHHQMTTGQPGRWTWSSPPPQAQAPGQPGQAAHEAQHASAPSGPHPSAAAAPHESAPGAAPHGAQPAATAPSSGWIYTDLRVNTKGIDGVTNLRGYEVWAQPVGTDNWYATAEATSGGQTDAYFADVLVRPEAGILLHYRATESGTLPELQAQIGCETLAWSGDRNYMHAELCQQMQTATVEATNADEAIREACGSYPGSGYVDEHQRNTTDHPEGECRKFEVWVGLPTVTQ